MVLIFLCIYVYDYLKSVLSQNSSPTSVRKHQVCHRMHKYAACVIGKFSETSVKIKFLRPAACYGLKKTKNKTKKNKKNPTTTKHPATW